MFNKVTIDEVLVTGVCVCGCGTATQPSPYTDRRKGRVRGQPIEYAPGHSNRGRDLTGQKFGRLAVLGIEETVGRISWRCRCDCGTETLVLRTNLVGGKSTSCGCLTRERGAEVKRMSYIASPTYSSAHSRVRRERGPASQFPCSKCHETSEQWAYDHLDPDELQEPGVTRRGEPTILHYSPLPQHYIPLCYPCHVALDRWKRPMNTVSVDEMLILSAVRYALGRKTYIVGVTATQVIEVWDDLTDQTKLNILTDIERARHDHRFGSDQDARAWNRVLQHARDVATQ